MKKYFWNILISIDQFANTVMGGDPDETVSSRMGKRTKTCRLCFYFCKLISLIDKRHCEKSIEDDEGDRAAF